MACRFGVVATYMGQGPDLIYLPEVDFDMEQFIADVRRIYEATGECFVAVSEGIHDKNGTLIAEYGVENAPVDAFGHKQLGGLASTLVNILRGHLGNVKMRGIELSLLQRCAAHCASETDVQEAFLAGKSAVEYAVNGVTDKMVAFRRGKNAEGDYQCEIELLDLVDVANTEKKSRAIGSMKRATDSTRSILTMFCRCCRARRSSFTKTVCRALRICVKSARNKTAGDSKKEAGEELYGRAPRPIVICGVVPCEPCRGSESRQRDTEKACRNGFRPKMAKTRREHPMDCRFCLFGACVRSIRML